MLKKSIYIAAATSSLMLLSGAALAGGCQVHGMQVDNTFNGPTTCTGATKNNLSVNGPLTVSNTTIKGNASIRGPVEAKDFSVKGNLVVFGPVQADQLMVGGKLIVQGPLQVKNAKLINAMINGPAYVNGSTIQDTLNYAGSFGAVTNSTVGNVLVRGSSSNPSVLCLSKSHITGNVGFVGTQGKVYLSGGSTIKGSVSGGQMVKGACPQNQ